MSHKHRPAVYNSLKEMLADCAYTLGDPKHIATVRYWTIIWNNWVAKNGNIPYVMKCMECELAQSMRPTTKPKEQINREMIGEFEDLVNNNYNKIVLLLDSNKE